MNELKDTLLAFADKLIEKLNALKTEIGQMSPFKGLSPDAGNSLTEDAEGKLYFKERTAAEVKTAYESNTNTNAFTDSHKSQVDGLAASLDGKVDKVEGEGLTPAKFTQEEKDKLAGIEDAKWKGEYSTIEAAKIDYPEGSGQTWHQDIGGWIVDVDSGAGADVVRYIWDASDLVWVQQTGSSTSETAASIKTKYESNADTNAFTDSHKTTVEGLPTNVEPAFTKKTAFNKDYGTIEGTTAQGNDSRILNGQTAYEWGDKTSDIQNHETRITTLENSGVETSPTRIDSWVLGYDSGLTFNPTFNFTIDGVSGSDSRQITLAAADPTNPRKDTFVVNISTQQIEVITGTPAANPFEPDIDFSIYLKGPVVDIPAGATTPANINITTVWNENTGTGGGEWNISNPHADYDYDNTENPKTGMKAIKVVGELVVNQILGFAAGADIPVSEAKEFQFDIQNITTGGGFHITVIGKRSNGRTESLQLPDPTGFDPANVSSYQTITLPIVSNQLVSIHEIRFVTEVAGYKYYFDNARLIGGEGTSSPTGDYVTRTEFETLDSEVVKSVSVNGGTPQAPDGSGNVDLTVSSGSDFNLDGGRADSVYTATQTLDGGNSQ